jgi:hypothetical protein
MSQIDGIIFDIETGPMPSEILRSRIPAFKAPANWKDSDKIEANIQEQERKWFDRAALDAQTGQVLAIGVANGGKVGIWDANDYTEEEILGEFWDAISEAGPTKRWIGFNIKGFDLPFLIRRSFFYGIVPSVQLRHGRFWDDRFIDLMELWQCGNREQSISLSSLSVYLGGKAKQESGADFHHWIKKDPAKAQTYLINDLAITAEAARRMLPYITSPEVAA